MPPRGLPTPEEIEIRRLAEIADNALTLALLEGYDEAVIRRNPKADCYIVEFFPQRHACHAAERGGARQSALLRAVRAGMGAA